MEAKSGELEVYRAGDHSILDAGQWDTVLTSLIRDKQYREAKAAFQAIQVHAVFAQRGQ